MAGGLDCWVSSVREAGGRCTEVPDVDVADLFVWAADDALVEGKSEKT